MPSLPAGTFPSTYNNSQYTSFERTPGAGYLTTVEGIPTGGSTVFDGTGDYLTTATDTDLIIGTNDFTIEFWVYLNSFSGYPIIFDRRASSANNQVLETQTNGKFRWYSGGSFRIESDTAITTGSWNHIAIVRASGTTKMMLNGLYQSTTYSDSTNYSGSSVILGKHYSNASSYVDGYISNYREVIGTALYQTANTGGSTYFDGTDDHIKVADNTSFRLGTGNFTIEMWVNFTTTSLEGGSNRRIFCLDESGNAVDNLQICIDDGSYRTNGDLFLYSNSDQGYLGVDIRSGWHHIAIVRNSGTLKFYLDGVEKDSNSNTQDYSPGGAGGPRPIFGQRGDDKGDYHGYISNFRMVVGTAVYTSNFTPSTSALTDITNTQLLTCQNSTGTITDNSSHSHSLSIHGNTQADTTHPFSNYYSIPTIPLTAISNTKLLTCQNTTGSISDVSGNSISITASGDAAANSSNPFAGGSTSTTTASFNLLGYNTSKTKLLVCHNSVGSISDQSLSNHTISVNGDAAVNELNPFTASTTSGGSTLFDGTDDNLSIPSIVIGTNDYTIEFWIYPTAISNYYHIYDGRGGSSGDAILIQMTNTGTFRFYSVSFRISGSAQISVNTWNHIALERVGNVNTLYVNGTSDGTYNDGGTSYVGPSNSVGRIGSNDAGGDNFFPGYISNFRIVVGSAVYNGNFTPSRSPLTAITNTQILTCQNSTGSITDASSNSHTITANGGAAANALTPFSSNPNGSTVFDGTGDYLSISASDDFDISDGEVTYEGWVYFDSVSSKQCIWEHYTDDNNLARLFFEGGNGDVLRLTTRSGGTNLLNATGTTTLTTSTWYHIAVTRSTSGDWETFINGTKDNGASGSESSALDTSGMTFYLGADFWATDRFLDGYISNFRIVKGTRVYTSNFTAPTTPLVVSYRNITTGNISHFGGGGLLAKVATRPSQTSFAFNIGDSDNSTAGGSIKLLGGHDSANSVDKFTSGTIYNFGGGGLLTKVLTRDSQTSFALNVGDSSKGTSGLPIRLLADDSANSLERFNTGTIYSFDKTALNTILSTRSPLTNFGGNVGSLADSGGSVGGGGGGGGGGGASSYEFVIIT